MKIYNVLNSVFSAPTAVSLLRELSQRNIGLTGRELSRITGITPQAAHNTLKNLESLKIVNKVTAGRAHIYTLNRNHFLAKKIITGLFELEKEFIHSIFEKIAKSISKDSISLIIFGSVARKEELIESDLDLCIVYRGKRSTLATKVSKLRDDLYLEFGVTLAPYYITQILFKSLAKTGKPPVKNILKDGKLISGKTMEALIHG